MGLVGIDQIMFLLSEVDRQEVAHGNRGRLTGRVSAGTTSGGNGRHA